jgi:glycosyltransferase involved in cell wall biosynthesis
MWNDFFRIPKEIVLSTPEERDFLQRRFRTKLDGPVIGIGVDLPQDAKAERFRQRFGIPNPYAIYVGRIDPSKGCEQLLEDFARVKKVRADHLLLVMLGRAAMPIPSLPFLRPLGFVDEETKFDALAGSEMLIMPSSLESLSISLLEVWSVGRPALVNAASDVLVGQSRRANAGLWYTDAAEMCAAIPILRDKAGEVMGANGRDFVARSYAWPKIVEQYQEVYDSLALPARASA